MRLVFIILVLWAALSYLAHDLVALTWVQAIAITGMTVGCLCLALAAMLSYAVTSADSEMDDQYGHWDDPLDGTSRTAIGHNIKNEDML